MYPNEIDKFGEKLNKIDGNTYVIEEEVSLKDGTYEGELQHDNVSNTSVRVYTGSKLTGDRIDNFILSTPSLTPWKRNIKIFSNVEKVYISYETLGDTIEAEDINKVQESIVNTQIELEKYKYSNDTRISNDENRLVIVENNKAEKTYVDTELNKRYTKDQTYSKTETEQRIQNVIGAAPAALDTLKEIADSLNNDSNFAATMTNQLSGKVDKINGKQLSTEDYTTIEKNKLAGIAANANNYIHPATHPATIIVEDNTHRFTNDTDKANLADVNSKKHTHNNLSLLETITQTLIDKWNSAYSHMSDTVKHITSDERSLWNTVSNKVDKLSGKQLSTEDYTTTEKNKLGGISSGANKVEQSSINGNIKIDGVEKTAYTHPGTGTNPHGTTKADVGLGSVTNDAQVKRSEMGISSGVATLDSTGVNAQDPKAHTHDDRYYTETEVNNKFVSKTDFGSAGYGDMLKSIYDTDNDGKVDWAEKVDWSGIQNKPTSFPADGGTASYLGNAVNVTDYNTLVPSLIASGNITPVKAQSSANSPWANTTSGFLIQSNGTDSFHLLIFRSGGDGWAYRSYYNGTWGSWKKWSIDGHNHDTSYLPKNGVTWNNLKGV